MKSCMFLHRAGRKKNCRKKAGQGWHNTERAMYLKLNCKIEEAPRVAGSELGAGSSGFTAH